MSIREQTLDQSPMIMLQDLEYDSLKHINLHIKSGEIYSIIGKNDCGKSELLRCINRVYEPKYGKIIIDNQNLNSILDRDVNNLRRQMALITKTPQLINNKNVFNNVALPLELQNNLSRNDIKRLVDPILHFTGITDQYYAKPSQLNTLQKQLVAIARALVTKPKALLCDDITYHLDIKSTYQLVNLLSHINKEFNMTMIIISNDIEVIKSLSHKVVVMDKGKIVEQAYSYEIFTKPKTEFAKELVRSATRQEMPWVYRRKIRFQTTQNQHPIVRISFTTTLATEHLLGQLIEAYQFKISIIQAYQEYIQQKPINVILAEIEGPADTFAENFPKAIEFLNQNELHLEVLGYVANVN
jgi:D-methionine transport system ATP-binding protein